MFFYWGIIDRYLNKKIMKVSYIIKEGINRENELVFYIWQIMIQILVKKVSIFSA